MDILKTIFSNGYKKFNNKPVSDSGVIELKNKIKECALKLLKGLERFGVLEDESVGRGTFANVPWIRFYYDDCARSPKKGVYVVYLFAKDEEKLYLTLNQGVESSSIEQQKTVKENIWANIPQSFFEKNTDKINSGNDGYDKSAIFYKKYEKDRLPSESEMKKDLEHMLEIYQKCKEKGILSSSTSLNSNPLVQIEKKVAENLNENINSVNSKNEKQLGTFSDSQTMQQIFFGAPGTGKSHKVNELVGEHGSYLAATDKDVRRNQFSQCGCAKANHYADVLSKPETFNQDVFAIDNLGELERLLESCEGDDKVKNPRHSALRAYIDFISQPMVFRTTFHPDYDYAQFVGSYKPKKDKDDPKRIVYSFVPQVFAKAYVAAWENYLVDQEKPQSVYLVIEEINRGNCAQIFGDIFQLLDRDDDGFSRYEIDADADFAEWLSSQELSGKLRLPPNFNILATMNTSDQSLFPMDSAFKRRFDWEYVPIDYNQKKAEDFKVQLKKKDEETVVLEFDWLHFLKKINADIYKVTESEDKQMGEFFVKPKDNVIDLGMFRSKVLFYLWDTVYKDEPDKKTIFHFNYPEKNGSRVTFQSLFGDDANAIEIIKQMMKNLDKAYESKDDSEFKNFKIVSEQ